MSYGSTTRLADPHQSQPTLVPSQSGDDLLPSRSDCVRLLKVCDVEARPEPAPVESTQKPADPNLVTWEGSDDPANPKNWPRSRKWRQIIMVSFFTLMSPVASSMLAPALPKIAAELNMPSGTVTSMSLSIFILAYAVGPLFLGPLSEILGRRIILQSANMFFLIFNIACSQAHTTAQFVAFRFLTGLGGSAPLAVGGGTIADLFAPEERGLALSIYSLAPLAGPALGPVAGGFIADHVSWRWVFYATCIADGVVQIVILRETYAPKILGDKAKRLRKTTGNIELHTQWERPDRTLVNVLANGLVTPFRLFLGEPIIQVLAAYMACVFGIVYLMLASFASVWATHYHYSASVSGLHYFALAIGFWCGSQIGSMVLDKSYARLQAKNNGVGTPEMRMPLLMFTAWLIPVGMLIFGWSADKKVYWLVPDAGIVVSSAGAMCCVLTVQSYIIDNFPFQAASAIAAASTWRSLAGFSFPLFADAMFSKLGIGWGCSVLALIGGIFIPAPFVFYRYGPWLRSKSQSTARGPSVA